MQEFNKAESWFSHLSKSSTRKHRLTPGSILLYCFSITTLVVLILANVIHWHRDSTSTTTGFCIPRPFFTRTVHICRQKLDRGVHFLPQTNYRVTEQYLDCSAMFANCLLRSSEKDISVMKPYYWVDSCSTNSTQAGSTFGLAKSGPGPLLAEQKLDRLHFWLNENHF